MIRTLANEKWKKIDLGYESQYNYAISNLGRLVSFEKKIEEGRLLKGGEVEGYRIFRYKFVEKKKVVNKHVFIHRLVAEYFLAKPKKGQQYVVHTNFKKANNEASNLKWASSEELALHHKKNPSVVKNTKALILRNKTQKDKSNYKLTETKVKEIKKRIFSTGRKLTLKQIADQYKISEMQLYRIKSGENWGHVKV
jgi:hypothetical protein